MSAAIVRPQRIDGAVLAGRRIVLTRARDQAGDFARVIRSLGGEPVIAPAIAIAPPEDWGPLDGTLRAMHDVSWIAFTSTNAVRAFVDRFHALELPPSALSNVRLAAIGESTAAVLTSTLRKPNIVATSSSGASLGESMAVRPGHRVLIPHGDLAGDALARTLTDRGAEPIRVVAYRTVPGSGIPEIVSGLRTSTIDALLFASGSAVRYVTDALAGEDLVRTRESNRPAIFCIGPATAEVARAHGIEPDGVANDASLAAMVDTMVQWFSARTPTGA